MKKAFIGLITIVIAYVFLCAGYGFWQEVLTIEGTVIVEGENASDITTGTAIELRNDQVNEDNEADKTTETAIDMQKAEDRQKNTTEEPITEIEITPYQEPAVTTIQAPAETTVEEQEGEDKEETTADKTSEETVAEPTVETHTEPAAERTAETDEASVTSITTEIAPTSTSPLE